MQDLLKKIVEMDEQARKVSKQAKSEKEAGELEIEKLREQIYDDYIRRAKDRVEKNIAVDRAKAEERIARFSEQAEKAKAEMDAMYEEKGEAWINEIVSRVLS